MSEESLSYRLSIVSRDGGKYKVELDPKLAIRGDRLSIISSLILMRDDLYVICPRFDDKAEKDDSEKEEAYEYNFDLLVDLIRDIYGKDIRVIPFRNREDGSG